MCSQKAEEVVHWIEHKLTTTDANSSFTTSRDNAIKYKQTMHTIVKHVTQLCDGKPIDKHISVEDCVSIITDSKASIDDRRQQINDFCAKVVTFGDNGDQLDAVSVEDRLTHIALDLQKRTDKLNGLRVENEILRHKLDQQLKARRRRKLDPMVSDRQSVVKVSEWLGQQSCDTTGQSSPPHSPPDSDDDSYYSALDSFK